MTDDATIVHQSDLNAGHIGKQVSGTTGRLDFDGILQSVLHQAETQVLAMSDPRPVRVMTRTTVTVSDHEFLLARGSGVKVR
jgi:hypothetical protein